MIDASATSKVILIVDDTPSNLQILFTSLEQAGLRVLVAQGGENALKIAETRHPNLILLDILMPGLNGFDVCRRLKANSNTQEIPVIFLTALSDSVNKITGFELGGVDYITKPIDQGEVLARIQTHLMLQEMRQHLAHHNTQLQQEISTRKTVERQLQDLSIQLAKTLSFEALVRRITEKIRDSIDEGQILQTATQELVENLSIKGGQIELYDAAHETVTIVYESGKELPRSLGITRPISDFPQLYQNLLQKIPLQLIENFPEDCSNSLQLTQLACPIFENHDRDGIFGNLWLFKPSNQVFEEFEVQLVQQVASQCAIAIRQARLYKAAQTQVDELEKLNRVKDDFLKTISHELRAPMSSIKLAAQTLEKFLIDQVVNPSPTFTKVFRRFQQACNRQNQLVDDLLSLCYLDAQAEAIVLEWIDLKTWIPEIVQLFLERTTNQQQQLKIDLAEELPLFKSDVSMLERILTELLNNACKYTPAGEKITVSVFEIENIVQLSVTNSGVEIQPEELDKIFDQFYRIPNNDPWQYGGTGVGLTLVKKMLELLDAVIEVESGENKTTFFVKFFGKNLGNN